MPRPDQIRNTAAASSPTPTLETPIADGSSNPLSDAGRWRGLRRIAMVKAERHAGDHRSGEVRCYLSLLGAVGRRIAYAVRAHWGIRNQLHYWVLDVTLREGDSRVHNNHAPVSLSTCRKLALHLYVPQALARQRNTQTLQGRAQR